MNTQTNNPQLKKNYRSKQHPSFEEREDIKARMHTFITQTKIANVFRTSQPNIAAAFNGKNTDLFYKIKNYVELHEARNGYNAQASQPGAN